MAEKTENTKNRLTRMLLSKSRRAQYVRLFAVLATCVVVVVAVALHYNGVAMTHEERVLACPVQGVVAHTHNESCYDADGNLVCALPEVKLHTHAKECYDEKGALICGKEEVTEEHVHGPGCFTTVTVQDAEETLAAESPAVETTPAATTTADANATEVPVAGASVAAMPAQNFSGEVRDQNNNVTLKVEVEAPEGAFPVNTTMQVAALDSNAVKGAVDEAVAQKTSDKVTEVQAVDIKFYNEAGQEIEPAVDISVRFASNVIAQSDNSYVVHVNKDGKGAVVDSLTDDQLAQRNQKAANDELYINANEFSPYVIVGTKALTTDVLLSDGNEYTVTVTYGKDAKIPEGATLKVTPFATDSKEYQDARKAVIADKQAKGESVDSAGLGLAAVDISILDASGKEIEPAATVTVNMKIKQLPEVQDLNQVKDSLAIQHHVETDKGVIVQTVYGGNTDATFEQKTDATVINELASSAVDPNTADTNAVKTIDGGKALDASYNVDVFSTFTVTWYNGNGYSRQVEVHYGYMNRNSFVEFSGEPHFTDHGNPYGFLIYDVPGYEYEQAYYSGDPTSYPLNSTRIQPFIVKSDGLWCGTTNGNSYFLLAGSQDSKTHIYMVYKPKTNPTQGGTSELPENQTWPSEAPQFTKSSTNNKNSDGTADGTNTISLDISGAEREAEGSTKANVIVVFDRSGSMSTDLNGKTRLQRAKEAVKSMAKTLYGQKDAQGHSLVKMGLVSFSTTATEDVKLSDDLSERDFISRVDALEADGGTNWEQALQLANRMAVDSDATTHIVFVTDGDPTFRMSRGNVADNSLDVYESGIFTYYRDNHVFGEGNSDSAGRNFDFATEQVKDIIGSNKHFYAIGVSSDVTKVQNLVTQGAVNGTKGSAFLATDSTALDNAFSSITQSINSTLLGFGDVKVVDGITALTNVDMKLQNVDPNSFKYYRYGGKDNKYGADAAHKTEWTTRADDKCNAASYNATTGSVEWNMGDKFQLESGVHYIVEFRAWPSQEAYDLIADLNNGVRSYDSLSDAEKAQIQVVSGAHDEYGNQQYALKTNTDSVNAKYKETKKEGEDVSVSNQQEKAAHYTEGTIQNINLESMKLTVQKTFEDDLTSAEDRQSEVTLVMNRRDAYQRNESGAYQRNENGSFADYAVKQGNNTSAQIVLNSGNNWTFTTYIAPGLINNGKVLEHGYDFTVTEPGIDRHYDLVEEIVNPMVVDGQGEYAGDTNGDQSLTAINRVKSGIDVWKNVYAPDGSTKIYPDDEFTIRGYIKDKNGNPFTWTEADGPDATGAYHVFDKDDNQIVTKAHFASTGAIELKLKAGEHARFINVPEGCTFEFTEVLQGNDYELMSLDATMQKRGSNGAYVTEANPLLTTNQATATLGATGVVGDKQYSITFNNKRLTPYTQTVKLRKVAVANDKNAGLSGAEFKLTIGDKQYNLTSKDDGYMWYNDGGTEKNTIEMPVTSANQTYTLEETKAPDGYLKIDGPITVQVTYGGVTATRPLDNEHLTNYTVDATASANGDKVYTIVIPNQDGNELPETGGIGTTTFYVAGAAIAAVGLYGLHRRRNATHN